jgi:hypothetical protein
MPSPGGQTSGMASHEYCCGRTGVGRGHPADLPEGLLRAPRGKPGTLGRRLAADVAPGDSAWSGCTRPTGCPTTLSGERSFRQQFRTAVRRYGDFV